MGGRRTLALAAPLALIAGMVAATGAYATPRPGDHGVGHSGLHGPAAHPTKHASQRGQRDQSQDGEQGQNRASPEVAATLAAAPSVFLPAASVVPAPSGSGARATIGFLPPAAASVPSAAGSPGPPLSSPPAGAPPPAPTPGPPVVINPLPPGVEPPIQLLTPGAVMWLPVALVIALIPLLLIAILLIRRSRLNGNGGPG